MDYAAINAQAQEMKNLNKAQVIASGGSSLGSSSGVSVGTLESAIARANSLANANSARSAEEARIQREWQEQQNAKAMEFNAAEAVKSRDWQQYMSNTAHQREIADLKAAGLNPVLSAMGGNGAAVTSGATAQGVTSAGAKGEVDTSANQAITNLLGSMVGYMSNLAATSVSAQASMANANKAAEVNKFIGELSSWTTLKGYDKQLYNEEYLRKNYPQTLYGYLPAALGVVKDMFGWTDEDLKNFGESIRGFFSKDDKPRTPLFDFSFNYGNPGSAAGRGGKNKTG